MSRLFKDVSHKETLEHLRLHFGGIECPMCQIPSCFDVYAALKIHEREVPPTEIDSSQQVNGRVVPILQGAARLFQTDLYKEGMFDHIPITSRQKNGEDPFKQGMRGDFILKGFTKEELALCLTC